MLEFDLQLDFMSTQFDLDKGNNGKHVTGKAAAYAEAESAFLTHGSLNETIPKSKAL